MMRLRLLQLSERYPGTQGRNSYCCQIARGVPNLKASDMARRRNPAQEYWSRFSSSKFRPKNHVRCPQQLDFESGMTSPNQTAPPAAHVLGSECGKIILIPGYGLPVSRKGMARDLHYSSRLGAAAPRRINPERLGASVQKQFDEFPPSLWACRDPHRDQGTTQAQATGIMIDNHDTAVPGTADCYGRVTVRAFKHAVTLPGCDRWLLRLNLQRFGVRAALLFGSWFKLGRVRLGSLTPRPEPNLILANVQRWHPGF
eukprot:1306336-Rhodomonas_salina.2